MINTDLIQDEIETNHAIDGKMITCMLEIDDFQWETFIKDDPKYIKHSLANKLAEVILENQLCAFTQYQTPEGMRRLQIRAFMTPSDKVQLLRQVVFTK